MSSVRRGAQESASSSGERAGGGVVRRVDELGRIVIPVEIRKRFGISVRDPLEIGVRGESIVLSKLQDACVFCGKTEQMVEFKGRLVCIECRTGLASPTLSEPAK